MTAPDKLSPLEKAARAVEREVTPRRLVAKRNAMCNRTIIHAPRSPGTVVKHEHRAPTDESVRLLSEMEVAAQQKVDRALRLEGNGFNGLVRFYRMAADQTITADCVFDLNGQRIKIEEAIDAYEQQEAKMDGRDALFDKLRDAVAKRLAHDIIAPSFAAHRPIMIDAILEQDQ